MKERPAFPARLDLKPKAGGAAGRVAPPVAPVQGLGLDTQAVRLRMVQRLTEEGIDDDMVLKAMATIERDLAGRFELRRMGHVHANEGGNTMGASHDGGVRGGSALADQEALHARKRQLGEVPGTEGCGGDDRGLLEGGEIFRLTAEKPECNLPRQAAQVFGKIGRAHV